MSGAQSCRGDRRRDASECRCVCGSLVARWVPAGVELKCRRCKRSIVLPLEPAPPSAPLRETAP